MPTRNVVLTDHQQDVIEMLVDSGRYQNASEVLREGLRLVEQRENEDALKLDALRKAAQVGLADLASGRFRDVKEMGRLVDDLMESLVEIQGDECRQELARRRTDQKSSAAARNVTTELRPA